MVSIIYYTIAAFPRYKSVEVDFYGNITLGGMPKSTHKSLHFTVNIAQNNYEKTWSEPDFGFIIFKCTFKYFSKMQMNF